jgi:signal transduction histidine kinase
MRWLARRVACGGKAWMAPQPRHRSPDWRALEEQDRHRLARDLHDEIGHSLVVLKLCLEQMALDLDRRRLQDVERKLRETTALVTDAIVSVRRVILDLGPAALDKVGVQQAIRSYAVQFFERTGFAVYVQASELGLPGRLPATHEKALFRILQGALSNVLEHSRARNVLVTLEPGPGPSVVMSVADDGLGFEAAEQKGVGLAAMRQRAEALGGTFRLQSWPARDGQPSRGTRVEVTLPLPGAYPR